MVTRHISTVFTVFNLFQLIYDAPVFFLSLSLHFAQLIAFFLRFNCLYDEKSLDHMVEVQVRIHSLPGGTEQE